MSANGSVSASRLRFSFSLGSAVAMCFVASGFLGLQFVRWDRTWDFEPYRYGDVYFDLRDELVNPPSSYGVPFFVRTEFTPDGWPGAVWYPFAFAGNAATGLVLCAVCGVMVERLVVRRGVRTQSIQESASQNHANERR